MSVPPMADTGGTPVLRIMPKRIAILGSTGSIGCNALDVIEHLGPDYRAVALSARSQTAKLLEQVRKHRPAAVTVADDAGDDCCREMERLGARVYRGAGGLVEMVQRDDVDQVLASIVGAAGLPAVFAAVQAGKNIALANKESLVVGGSLLIAEAKKRGVTILPVDSEHSAVFQAMLTGKREEIHRVILTASGGPFRTWTPEQIARATPAEALNHPTWRMGNKVTIDSATMFNKGLELIEACWLFDLPPGKVEVVVHPESVVHSMVEFVDGSTIAQLSPPDMKTPIQYALTYPNRLPGCGRRMDWTQSVALQFEPPVPAKFPSLAVAYEVAETGGTSGAVMNAANEVAVEAFVAGKIAFGGISDVVGRTIRGHRLERHPSMDDLLEADRWARSTAEKMLN
ncbi:MAG: 1-deoxy-D-xylulose-5-phosphate reductoisomerase [Tepidisphaeraceae bacterium]